METKLQSRQIATQVHDSLSTTKIHTYMGLSLVPAALWGVWLFGWWSALILTTAIGAAVLSDMLLHRLRREPFTWEGSSALWGFLIGLSLPPSVPLYIPVAASAFAVLVVKGVFGGLGAYWLNPVLAARAFVLAAWAGPMTTWIQPVTEGGKADILTSATPLTLVKDSLAGGWGKTGGPMDILAAQGYPRSGLDQGVTDWLNNHLFSFINLNLPGGYIDLMTGHGAGAIGEVSGLLILAATVFLLARGIVDWRVPTAAGGLFILLIWSLGGLVHSGRFFAGDVLFHLFSGGFLLGIFFLATEHSTTPLTRQALWLYGAGVGILTFGLRLFGAQAEGVGTAILVMNLLVPALDRRLKDRPFGAKNP